MYKNYAKYRDAKQPIVVLRLYPKTHINENFSSAPRFRGAESANAILPSMIVGGWNDVTIRGTYLHPKIITHLAS